MKVKLEFPVIRNIALFVIAIFGSLYLAETIASLFFDKLEYSKRVLPSTYVSDNETGYAYKSNTQTQLQILNGPETKITIGNIKYHALISKFKEKTGCPLVVNTSFNVSGEPIICTPTDAFKCFMGTKMDVLAIGDYVLYKEQQDKALSENYEERYELD